MFTAVKSKTKFTSPNAGLNSNGLWPKFNFLTLALILVMGFVCPTTAQASETSIAINEVDCHGNDWVELFNRSSESVDISGWILTDKKFSTKKLLHLYKFPTGTVLASRAHLVVQQTGLGDLKLPFGISCAKGGVVRLGNPIALTSITLIDELNVPIVPAHVSYGRVADGSNNSEFTVPTKRDKNQTALPIAPSVQRKVCAKKRVCVISIRATQTTKFQLLKKQTGVSISQAGKLTISAGQLTTKTYPIKLINTIGSRVINFRVTIK